MKIYFRHVDYVKERSFAYYDKEFAQFDAPIHMHPEFELAWIHNTEGKMFIGNNISDYYENELVLIGPNIPHCWRNKTHLTDDKAHSIVIHFRQDFLGEEFFLKPELTKVHQLLTKAQHGIVFRGDKTEVIKLLSDIGKEGNYLEQLLTLLKILKILSEQKDLKLVNSEPVPETISHFDCERINKIYNFIMENFKEEIKLDDVAKSINLSPKSFCRYFKKMTQKTLMERVNEYRIEVASGLLVNSDRPVSDICFESGFRNISHFNNCFKAIKKRTPFRYRKEFLEQQKPGDAVQLKKFNMQ